MLTKAGNCPLTTLQNDAFSLLDAMPFGFLAFMHSFLTAMHTLYCRNAAKEQRAAFAEVAGLIVTADKQAIKDGNLIIPSKHGRIVIEQVKDSGQSKLQITMNGESVYLDELPTIEALVDQLNADIMMHPDTYAEKGVSFKLNPDDDLAITNKYRIDHGKITSSVEATGGKISDVTKITYQNGETYFYKPLNPKALVISAAEISGVPTKGSARNLAYRSLFTYELSESLGFHVIPEIGFAENLHGDLGLVQKQAPGETADAVFTRLNDENKFDELKSNTRITKKLVELQLLDALTGQVDRHCNNYYIDLKTGTVSGIDNDACAGKNITHPHNMIPVSRIDGYLPGKLSPFEDVTVKSLLNAKNRTITEEAALKSFHEIYREAGRCVLLPPVMDTEMVEQFKNLSSGQLMRKMSRLHFGADEIKAAISRLDALKLHISVLEKRDLLEENQKAGIRSIIRPDEWGTRETQARLYPKASGNAMPVDTTYMKREIAMFTEFYIRPLWTYKKLQYDPLTVADLNKMDQAEYDQYVKEYQGSMPPRQAGKMPGWV